MTTALDIIVLICAIFNIVSWLCHLFKKNTPKEELEKLEKLERENKELKEENDTLKAELKSIHKFYLTIIRSHFLP